VDIAAHPIP